MVIGRLIPSWCVLVQLVSRNAESDIDVVKVSRLQENGYDCGVWILACLSAVLRGYTSVHISSSNIAEFRQRIFGLIYSRAVRA